MGRLPIKQKPLTPAERVRRHREAKRKGISLRPVKTTDIVAREAGQSPRAWAYMRAIERYGIPDLSGLVGQIGVNLLADLARHTRRDVQRRFVAILEAEGPKAARAYARDRVANRKART